MDELSLSGNFGVSQFVPAKIGEMVGIFSSAGQEANMSQLLAREWLTAADYRDVCLLTQDDEQNFSIDKFLLPRVVRLRESLSHRVVTSGTARIFWMPQLEGSGTPPICQRYFCALLFS